MSVSCLFNIRAMTSLSNLFTDATASGGMFGQGTGPIHLTELRCTGSEDNLLNCPGADTPVVTCNHQNDAGVVCNTERESLNT